MQEAVTNARVSGYGLSASTRSPNPPTHFSPRQKARPHDRTQCSLLQLSGAVRRARRRICRYAARGDVARCLYHAEGPDPVRSEEHTSELQSLMRITYAVFCLKKK